MSARLYRRLLALLPPAFRHRYGDDMVADLEERLGEAPSAGARLVLALRALLDLGLVATRERLRALVSPFVAAPTLGSLREELRWSLRSLPRYPIVSAVAVLTLALAIGSTTTVFSVVHSLLIAPLPYDQPDRLVLVWPEAAFNKALVRRMEQAMPAVSAISGVSNWTFTLTGVGEPEEILGSLVSTNHFAMLRVQAALGRTFRDDEDEPGRNQVVVLSHALWQRRFGGDPAILGRSIPLAGDDVDRRTVIGVMPESYRPIAADKEVPQFWVPLARPKSWSVAEDNSWYVNWRVARLRPGATLAAARAQLRAEAQRLRREGFETIDDEMVHTADVVPLSVDRAEGVGRPLWLLLGAIGLVLLIACANVANLLLARGEARERELAVRRALGATATTLVRQLLFESLLLALAGGALGLALAAAAVHVLASRGAHQLARLAEVRLDLPVLLFAMLLSVGAAALFGTLPALRGARRAAAGDLRRGVPGALGGTRSGLPRWLVAAQVALAVVVAVGASLMLRSLQALYAIDPGFDARGVLTLRVSPPPSRYRDAAAGNQLFDRVFPRLAALPGVERVGGIQILPLTGNNWSFPSYVDGHPVAPGAAPPTLGFRVVRPGYFETLGIPLKGGRLLEDRDGVGDAPDLALVNETLARSYWPEDPLHAPLGREIHLFSPKGGRFVRIVGVVGDVRQHTLDAKVWPEIYVTAAEWTWPVSLWVVMRTHGDPMALVPAVRAAVWSIDPDVPISGVAPMDEVVTQSAGTRRLLGALLTAFGALALALGAVGVFGVTAYTVARRVPELGVRKALGATTGTLLGDTVGDGMRPVSAGIACGLLLAILTGRLLQAQLYGITARDPLALTGAVAVLLGVGVLSTALPAWRASRVDASRALREQG